MFFLLLSLRLIFKPYALTLWYREFKLVTLGAPVLVLHSSYGDGFGMGQFLGPLCALNAPKCTLGSYMHREEFIISYLVGAIAADADACSRLFQTKSFS